MTGPTTLREDLAAWCADYVAAFSAFDAEAVGAHWQFPALVIQGDRHFVFETAERFNANTGRLLDFYRDRGVARARRRLEAAIDLAPDVSAIRVTDAMLDAGDSVIVTWSAGYTLRRTGEGWRAVMAVATGEGEAWAQAGTPMGGGRPG